MRNASIDYELAADCYVEHRRPDPRIARFIRDALGDASTVVNVGAGTGSYEPRDRYVLAVEPSQAMRAARPAHLPPAIDAVADSLPVNDSAFDAATAFLTVHHWDDPAAGLRELRRVARRSVIVLTFDAERLADYWLIADYLPEVAADNRRRFPSIEAVCEQLGGARVEVVPIPLDCSDGFFEAFFGRPEAILDPRLRAAQSGWGRLPREVAERAISKLEEDLKSGRWDERHASLRQAPAYDAGLRLIVASETTTRPHRPPRAASRTSVASSAPEPAPASERRQRPGGDPQVSVVVVFDSGSQGRPDLSGRTEVVAKEIVAGASNVPNTAVTLVSVADPEYPWELLDAADAIVFGCPTYMGSGSARLKAFMEASLRPQWTEQRWRDKLAAGFTNSAGMSGDKLQTLQQLAGFAAQHGMTWVSLGLLPGWQDSLGSPEDTNRLAGFLGLMTQSNSDQGPADAPPNSDRYTGRLFGERIARAAHRWRAGANPTSEAAAIGREEAGADDRIKELRA